MIIARRSLILILSVIVLMTLELSAEEVARLYSKEGTVDGSFGKSESWQTVEVGTSFAAGDAIRVGKHGRAGVMFVDGMLVRLSNYATIRFKPVTKKKFKIKVDEGKAHIFSRRSAKHPDLESPVVSAAIRGTEFVIEVTKTGTKIDVIDGAVEASNKLGTAQAGKGQRLLALKGQAPKTELLAKPFDAVQWALNYPYILSDSDLAGLGRDAGLLKQANLALANGDLNAATTAIGKLRKKTSVALALETVIAVVQNNLSAAEKFYTQAQAFNKPSPALALAGSYLFQARYQLNKAQSILLDSIANYKSNKVLNLRLAELALANADTDAAQSYLNNVAISDADAYYYSLRAFIALIEGKRSLAVQEFEKARSLDTSFALAYFGSGLAAFSTGAEEQAKQYLEQAVHLSPSNSLYRSYLGKAFFETEMETTADHEFDLAVELDQNDPTPHLYQAFSNLSQNKLVEALQDVEKSIELNDNRAVYRSRFLLDQDIGTRSAGLSRIFTELGFDQAARIEAIKSLQEDYSNYSAHRLLADSYDNITLLDSRLSELRIANLLAPLSFNLFNSIGSEASFQNYDALFDRDQHRTAFGIDAATEDDFLQGQMLHSGKTEKAGYLMRYLTNIRNGSKKNRFSRVHEVGLAGQYQLTPDLRVIADGSYQYINQDFGAGEYDGDTTTDSYDTYLGANLNLGPGKKLLAQVSYEYNRDDERELREAPGIVEITSPLEPESEVQGHLFVFDSNELQRVELFKTSLQYIHTESEFTGVLGGQFFRAWTRRAEQAGILADFFEVTDIDGVVVGEGFLFDGLGREFNSLAKNQLTAYDMYGYLTYHITDSVDLTLGGSLTDVERDLSDTSPYLAGSREDKRFNPKIGLSFYLDPAVTLRAAYFEGLRKSLLLDQVSLEPSLVAGINQRFNDFALTKARNYGIGLDYKLPASTYIGVEAVHRAVREDRTDTSPAIVLDFDTLIEENEIFADSFDSFSDQNFINAYWYQVLSNQWVSGVEYAYGHVDLRDPGIDQEVHTHKTKIGVSHIHPWGLKTSAYTTWRQQARRGFSELSPIEDFWVTDIVLRYRLPHRHGSIALSFLNVFDENFVYDQGFVPIEAFVENSFTAALSFSYNF